ARLCRSRGPPCVRLVVGPDVTQEHRPTTRARVGTGERPGRPGSRLADGRCSPCGPTAVFTLWDTGTSGTNSAGPGPWGRLPFLYGSPIVSPSGSRRRASPDGACFTERR